MGEVIELQDWFGSRHNSVSFFGRKRSNMANMTAVKKRPKGGASQAAGESEAKVESQDSVDSLRTDSHDLTQVVGGAAAGGRAVSVQAPAEDEQILVVREYVSRAAQILQSLGPEYERVAWLLEDTLSYLEDADEEDESAFERIRIEEL